MANQHPSESTSGERLMVLAMSNHLGVPVRYVERVGSLPLTNDLRRSIKWILNPGGTAKKASSQ